MEVSRESARELESLRDRLSSLSEANIRLSESLDFDRFLSSVLNYARTFTTALYGDIALLDDCGQVLDLLSFGMANKEAE